MDDVLGPEGLSSELSGRLGRPLRWFEQVGSTNDVALDWVADGAPEGALVATNHQTAGRGRRGRSWWSRPGAAAQFSLVLRPAIEAERLGLLTAGLGVAVAEAVAERARLRARIKWPNDVCVDGRKLAGILVETRLAGASVEAAVAGIGINCFLRTDELPPEMRDQVSGIAAEVERGGGLVPRRAELIAAVLARIEALYPMITDKGRSDDLLDRATELSAVVGKRIVVRFPDSSTIEGSARRLLPSGGLEVEVGEGIRAVEIGEIEHVRPIP
jgi:BirA family transcriptional regulator, biotin operon repressor / biotin---[acetyl-CoA-carboxylase] ligase